MTIRTNQKLLTAAFGVAVVLGTVTVPVPAQADGGCIPGDTRGMVPRNARPGDIVCVPDQIAKDIQFENSIAAKRVDPNGAYGPLSCKSGFVWREAFDGDQICVNPARRVATWQQNANAGVGATGGLQPQPGAGCTWKYRGTGVLELDNGALVEVKWVDLLAVPPFRKYKQERVGTSFVRTGDIISGGDAGPGKTAFTIAWLDESGARVDGDDFVGEIDPNSGTLSGTTRNDLNGTIGWRARERWTCAR